jgi:hypothetical protein
MTLDVNSPADTDPLSDLAADIREGRVDNNALWAAISTLGMVSTYRELNVAAGTTVLDIDTDIGNVAIEIINITGAGVSQLAQITGGTAGQIKIFYCGDANISFLTSATEINGTFSLNQPSGTYGAYARDVLCVANFDGDGSTDHGFWRELFRTASVL